MITSFWLSDYLVSHAFLRSDSKEKKLSVSTSHYPFCDMLNKFSGFLKMFISMERSWNVRSKDSLGISAKKHSSNQHWVWTIAVVFASTLFLFYPPSLTPTSNFIYFFFSSFQGCYSQQGRRQFLLACQRAFSEGHPSQRAQKVKAREKEQSQEEELVKRQKRHACMAVHVQLKAEIERNITSLGKERQKSRNTESWLLPFNTKAHTYRRREGERTYGSGEKVILFGMSCTFA